ncbi:hypothetical protein [Agromyces arachidis]|uniref:hypothetical protein n=1 Tax=Agromyces arachidis TaxID=766966 RepID=UPI004056D781
MDLANDFTANRTQYGGDVWLQRDLERRRMVLERQDAAHPPARHLEEHRFRLHIHRLHWPHRHAHAMVPIGR